MKTILVPLILLGAHQFATAADWPQWRGPARDGHAAGQLTALPKELKPVWKISAGPGHSSPVLAGGKLIYLDEQDKRKPSTCSTRPPARKFGGHPSPTPPVTNGAAARAARRSWTSTGFTRNRATASSAA